MRELWGKLLQEKQSAKDLNEPGECGGKDYWEGSSARLAQLEEGLESRRDENKGRRGSSRQGHQRGLHAM